MLVLAQAVSEHDEYTATAQAPVVTLAGEECMFASRDRAAACNWLHEGDASRGLPACQI